MTPHRPRIWVVLLGCAIGLLAIAPALGAYVVLRLPQSGLADRLAADLLAGQPLVGRIVEADPPLRALLLSRTRIAYEQGGRAQADRTLQRLIHSEIAAYAGDRTILDCGAAWRDATRAMLAEPSVCRAFLDRRYDDPKVQSYLQPTEIACDAALIDGGRLRLTRAGPDVLSDAQYLAIAAKLAPAPSAGDDRQACQAAIAQEDRLAAQPPAAAARYLRTLYRNGGRDPAEPSSLSPLPTAPVAAAPPAPKPAPLAEAPADDLHCAAPGTVFTLSEEGPDGRPVTRQALGQQGWDCRWLAADRTEHGLWGGRPDNPLKLLWPLAPGKTAQTEAVLPGGIARMTSWRVGEAAPYWLPWGWVTAYSVDADVHEGPDRHYLVTQYWSPELGFMIGARHQALHGELPADLAADWQLIARAEPAPGPLRAAAPATATADRGVSLPRKMAADDIRTALTRAEAVHPRLYWYAVRRRVLEREAALIAALPDPAAPSDVYHAVADLVGMLGDSHIALSPPASAPGDAAADDDAGLRLESLPGSLSLLVFDRMTADPALFARRLESLFTEISRARPKGLIIDLRANAGGDAALGDALLDYVSSKPRRAAARKLLQASPECRAWFAAARPGSDLDVAIRRMEDGQATSWDVAVQTPAANTLRFDGPVAVLIGPGTKAAANRLAAEIKDFHLATLIGQPTAESPNGYDNACPISLPNTQMELRVPSTYLVRADGRESAREEVRPDITVNQGRDEAADLVAARRALTTRPPAVSLVSYPDALAVRELEALRSAGFDGRPLK